MAHGKQVFRVAASLAPAPWVGGARALAAHTGSAVHTSAIPAMWADRRDDARIAASYA